MGGGRMGEALVAGLLNAGWPGHELHVVEPVAARRKELSGRYDDLSVGDAPVTAEGAVIAVKPGDVEAACLALAAVAPARVLSIAAGVPVARLEVALGPDTAVVRAMPNMPALVGAGASAIAGGRWATEADLAWAEEVLGAVSTVVRVAEG